MLRAGAVKCVNYVGVGVSFGVSFVWKCGKTEEHSAMKGRTCDCKLEKKKKNYTTHKRPKKGGLQVIRKQCVKMNKIQRK